MIRPGGSRGSDPERSAFGQLAESCLAFCNWALNAACSGEVQAALQNVEQGIGIVSQ